MDIKFEISKLKKQKNAVILAHNYQLPEVQDIADFVGDSYGLSQMAVSTNADVIVFCGVHFMAETAKIICPDKTVLIPEIEATCPMAEMITAEKLRALKQKHPNALVMTYINSTAQTKAESDVICTSSNALTIAKNLSDNEILFVPDKYLGSFVAKHNPDKNFILYDGYCNVHARIMPDDVINLKSNFPNSVVLAHPECRVEVVDLADEALSTTGMLNFAKNSKHNEFIICTEIGIMHQLKKDSPHKIFHHISPIAECINMKKTTLEKVLVSLDENKYEITVDKVIAKKATTAIQNMFKYAT